MKETIITAIIVGVVIITATVLLLIFGKPVRKVNMSYTKKITYIAILSALCTICNIYTIGLSKSVFLSIVSIPCFIAGYMLGFIEGFAVGFIGDLLGSLINPFGPYNPVIGIASGMWGFVPGILFTYFRGNDRLKTVISFSICLVVCTICLNTFGLWLIYGLGKKTFFAYLWVRLPLQVVVTLVNMFLALSIMVFLPHFVDDKKE